MIMSAWRGWRPPPTFWGAAATAVTVWFAAAVSDFPPYGRPPTEPRYLASDAILILVCLCTAVPRPRLTRGGVVIAGLVVIVVCATNVDQYRQQHAFFLAGSRQQSAELGALELMRPFISPQYDPGSVDANLIDDSAGRFLSAVSAFGLREDSPQQILARPEGTRVSADQILAPNELTLAQPALTPTVADPPIQVLSGAPTHHGGCLIVGDTPLEVKLPPGRYTIRGSVLYASALTMGRLASTFDYGLGTVPVRGSATLSVHADDAPRFEWRASLTGTGARLCARG